MVKKKQLGTFCFVFKFRRQQLRTYNLTGWRIVHGAGSGCGGWRHSHIRVNQRKHQPADWSVVAGNLRAGDGDDHAKKQDSVQSCEGGTSGFYIAAGDWQGWRQEGLWRSLTFVCFNYLFFQRKTAQSRFSNWRSVVK